MNQEQTERLMAENERLSLANTDLANEVVELRKSLGNLYDAVWGMQDMDEMDGPEYVAADERLTACLLDAYPRTENGLINAALSGAPK